MARRARAGGAAAGGRPGLVARAEPLAEGEVLDVDGLLLDVLSDPPGTPATRCRFVCRGRAVLTGDTVLGRGTTVVAHPDGRLGDYLDSLRRLERRRRRAVAGPGVWPGHGPVLDDPAEVLGRLPAAPRERAGPDPGGPGRRGRSPQDVVAVVYAEVDRALWPAAELSVRAQLEYLGRLSGLRARRRSRSTSSSTTARASSRSQPREAKSASALFTVSREAPTSWASSSWVRSWETRRPSSTGCRTARTGPAVPWPPGPGTSEKTRSASVLVGPPQPPGQRATAAAGRPPDGRSARRSAPSLPRPISDGVGDRGRGGVARSRVEQGQLAEHLARPEDRQQVLPAVAGSPAELHLAVDDHVEPVARCRPRGTAPARGPAPRALIVARSASPPRRPAAANSGACRTTSSSTRPSSPAAFTTLRGKSAAPGSRAKRSGDSRLPGLDLGLGGAAASQSRSNAPAISRRGVAARSRRVSVRRSSSCRARPQVQQLRGSRTAAGPSAGCRPGRAARPGPLPSCRRPPVPAPRCRRRRPPRGPAGRAPTGASGPPSAAWPAGLAVPARSAVDHRLGRYCRQVRQGRTHRIASSPGRAARPVFPSRGWKIVVPSLLTAAPAAHPHGARRRQRAHPAGEHPARRTCQLPRLPCPGESQGPPRGSG